MFHAVERYRRQSPWSLALCAYLAGELERAYELLDELEAERPEDLALQFLLWRSARAIGHAQLASIRQFAEQAARRAWLQLKAAAVQGAPTASALQLQYAVAIVPELESELPGLAGQLGVQLPAAGAELQPVEGALELQLERVVVFRVRAEAVGRSPLGAAAASTHALAAAAGS